MTRISQIIAVVGGVKNDVTMQLAQIERDAMQPELLHGISKSYRPRDDNGVQRPAQSTRVQVTVDDVLAKTEQLYGRLFDVTRTLDEANAGAAADVIVDGRVILPQVTTGHLLFLERELANLHSLILRLPTLDQAETWTDEGTEPGQHKTLPVETTSNDKHFYNHTRVKAEVIDGHVIQPVVDVMSRDEVVGYWTTVKFSGAMDPRRKREILDRLIRLRDAVKFAREEANAGEAADVKESKRIFDFVVRG